MSHWTHGKNTYIDSVRLTRAQFDEILDESQRSRCQAPSSNRRQKSRQNLTAVAGVLLEIEHPGGAVSRFIVRPRDISQTGMGFMHGGFLYKGSKVTITIVMMDREMIVLRGQVARCRHLKARIHEIGMSFAEPLDFDPFGSAPPGSDAQAEANAADAPADASHASKT